MKKSFVMQPDKNRITPQIGDQILHQPQALFVKGKFFQILSEQAPNNPPIRPQANLLA